MAMRIGDGKDLKSGVRVGTYGESAETLGWIEPACDNPKWILWFDRDGNAQLYTDRDAAGGVLGEPLEIRAKERN